MPRRRTQPAPPADTDQRTQVRSLLAETQALSARLAALNEVAAVLQSSLDTNTVLQTLAREARWILDFQYCSITERHGDEYREIILRHPSGVLPLPQPIAAEGLIARVVRTGTTQLLSDLTDEPAAPAGMASAVIVPLRSRGEVIGALSFFAEQPGHYRFDDLRIAAALAAQAGMMVQNTRLYQDVTEARDELHTILESISDGVIVVDQCGSTLLSNRAARLMLGLESEALSGRRLVWLLAGARNHGKRLIRPGELRTLINIAQSQTCGTHQLSDGRHIEWAYTRLHSNEAEPGYVITVRDISDRIELEELRDDMIAMLVHDLRTPLSGIMMGIDLLDMIGDEREERAEILARARRSSQLMLTQINTILDLRRLEAGHLTLQREQHDLGILLQQVAESFKLQAQLESISIGVHIAPNLPLVAIDVQLIGRVLENLIGNALKFSDPGGRVELHTHVTGAMLEVEVRDKGIGVPDHLRGQIFAKYIQVQGERSRRGFGLGLNFCRMAVEAHQGRIGVRDNPGGGSIFWFLLPVEA